MSLPSPKLPIYDDFYLKLLSRMTRDGPRNLSALSRELKVPKRTLHARVSKLRERGLLNVSAIPSLKRLGLIDVYVLTNVRPSLRRAAERALKLIDYWWRYYEVIGRFNGLFFHYLMPVNNVIDLEEYLEELKRERLVIDCQVSVLADRIHYLLNPYGVKDLEGVLKRSPKDYSLMADKYDVLIVSKLQENAFARLSEVAKEVGKSRSLIKYHYDTHVKDELIKGYEVITPRVEPSNAIRILVSASFKKEDDVMSYFHSLRGNPLVIDVGKEAGSNNVFTLMEVKVDELLRVISSTFIVPIEGYWISFLLGRERRKSLPHNLFHEGGWRYPKDAYLDKLRELKGALREGT